MPAAVQPDAAPTEAVAPPAGAIEAGETVEVIETGSAAAPVDTAVATVAVPELAWAPRSPVALSWIDDDAVPTRLTPADLTGSTNPYLTVSPDLLARRPRRSPVRPGVVVPILAVLGFAGAYAATTLLWPLHAVAPTVTEVALADVTAPISALTWPGAGSAAVGVAGIDSVSTSTADAASIASITKLVTVLMVLDEMPLAPGEQGPTFAFTQRDRTAYNNYLARDESALNVPVGGTLTEYQMLQGILIGSAGNYTDRIASTIWPTDAVFAAAARTWLSKHNLPGITMFEPTGIDPANTADPASLITLARLAMTNPVIAEIVRTPTVDLPGAGLVQNTNNLLVDSAVVGLKTGMLFGAYNLLAAKELTIGETPVRVYAAVLGQPSGESRDGETARLLTEVAAEVAAPTILPAGTVAGVISTPWGVSVNMVTDADTSVLLWNGGAAKITTTLDLGEARDANATVGSVRLKGALNSATVGVQLSGDITDPDAWWRLTHPLQLFGLAD